MQFANPLQIAGIFFERKNYKLQEILQEIIFQFSFNLSNAFFINQTYVLHQNQIV